MHKTIKLWFCDFWHPETEDEIRKNPLFQMIARRFNIVLDFRSPQFILYSCFGSQFRRYLCPRIFYVGENIRPNFVECDFSLSFDSDIAGRNHYLPFYALDDLSTLLAPCRADIAVKTAFCNFIYSNPKCAARNDFFRMLSSKKQVDSPGILFNNMPRIERPANHKRQNKIEFMRRYKFTISFENSSYPGYVTEKIIDAFMAGTVPIYWGSPDIAKQFNPNAFINCHDFPNFDSVVRHVIEVDGDDGQYRRYASVPPFAKRLPRASLHARALDFLEYAFTYPPKPPTAANFIFVKNRSGQKRASVPRG